MGGKTGIVEAGGAYVKTKNTRNSSVLMPVYKHMNDIFLQNLKTTSLKLKRKYSILDNLLDLRLREKVSQC